MDTHELIEHVHKLGGAEGRAVASFLRHETVAGNVNAEFREQLSFGQRMADRVAAIGGSWAFVLSFLLIISVWMYFNVAAAQRFDPYPFILLNLVLSCLAALQAPIIMMSQNRQAAKDRLTAQNDYEVNLKAEIEVAAMSAKIDELMDAHWRELLELQMRQVELLERIEARAAK
ncbi:MAG: DUF1003 domain-containing protein [Bryobacterales bacterium]|nr:DUF1003 domain-containing protein [Acidobacteriota bacterium]MCB9384994.1 DUF1003 domain-containing protein [Bryobacterales bacterium]